MHPGQEPALATVGYLQFLIPGAVKIRESSEGTTSLSSPWCLWDGGCRSPFSCSQFPRQLCEPTALSRCPQPGAGSVGAGGWQGAHRSPRSQSAVIEGSPEPLSPRVSRTSIRGICKPLAVCYLSGDAEVSHMEALTRQQPGTGFGGVARTQPFVNCREAGTRPLTHLMSSGKGNFTLCLEQQ